MLAHHFTWGISEQMVQQCNRGESRMGRGEFKKQGTDYEFGSCSLN